MSRAWTRKHLFMQQLLLYGRTFQTWQRVGLINESKRILFQNSLNLEKIHYGKRFIKYAESYVYNHRQLLLLRSNPAFSNDKIIFRKLIWRR